MIWLITHSGRVGKGSTADIEGKWKNRQITVCNRSASKSVTTDMSQPHVCRKGIVREKEEREKGRKRKYNNTHEYCFYCAANRR